MKKADRLSWVVLGALLSFVSWASAQGGPAGNYEAKVQSPGSYIWDLARLPNLTTDYSMEIDSDDSSVELHFPRNVQIAGSGKISGTGSHTVQMRLDDDEGLTELDFPGTYKTTGVITSSRGVSKVNIATTVTGTAVLDGASRRLSATENITATVYNTNKTVSGTAKTKASASGLGSINSTDSWANEPMEDVVDGSWTLRLLNLVTAKNKVTGTADVTLHTSSVHQFTVKGTYNPRTGTSRLMVTGLGAAKGASVTVTIGPGNTITSIKGKMFGQAVDVILTVNAADWAPSSISGYNIRSRDPQSGHDNLYTFTTATSGAYSYSDEAGTLSYAYTKTGPASAAVWVQRAGESFSEQITLTFTSDTQANSEDRANGQVEYRVVTVLSRNARLAPTSVVGKRWKLLKPDGYVSTFYFKSATIVNMTDHNQSVDLSYTFSQTGANTASIDLSAPNNARASAAIIFTSATTGAAVVKDFFGETTERLLTEL